MMLHRHWYNIIVALARIKQDDVLASMKVIKLLRHNRKSWVSIMYFPCSPVLRRSTILGYYPAQQREDINVTSERRETSDG